MIELSVIRDLIAIFGVIAGFSYYVLTVRATRKNSRVQLVSQLSRNVGTENGVKHHFMLLNMDWENYEDFEKKYGSDTNLESVSMRYSNWNTYNDLGYMLRKGMVDSEDLYNISGTGIGVIYQWAKWGSIIREQRRRYNGSAWMKDIEYLAGEMLRIKLREDPSFKVPETFSSYIPDR